MLGVVAYRKWALGVAGVLLMGAVIVASVVTRASVKPLDAIPSLIGTVAGLVVLRLLITRLWRMQAWPDAPADVAREGTRTPGHHAGARSSPPPASPRRRSAIAATGGRLLSAARSNVAQARESLQLPAPGQGRRRRPRRGPVQGARASRRG